MKKSKRPRPAKKKDHFITKHDPTKCPVCIQDGIYLHVPHKTRKKK